MRERPHLKFRLFLLCIVFPDSFLGNNACLRILITFSSLFLSYFASLIYSLLPAAREPGNNTPHLLATELPGPPTSPTACNSSGAAVTEGVLQSVVQRKGPDSGPSLSFQRARKYDRFPPTSSLRCLSNLAVLAHSSVGGGVRAAPRGCNGIGNWSLSV